MVLPFLCPNVLALAFITLHVSMYLESESGFRTCDIVFQLGKSILEDLPFLQFCNKYDICN